MTSETRPFDLVEGIAVLERTPAVLDAWLRGLPDRWLRASEGGDTWSPFDVVGHLVHLERTDWMVRVRRVMAGGEERRFEPVDRFAQLESSVGKDVGQLLDEFAAERAASLTELRGLAIGPAELLLEGEHPALGRVTLRNLLATWVAHDLGHLVQVGRVMARRYRGEVGPWAEYLGVMG